MIVQMFRNSGHAFVPSADQYCVTDLGGLSAVVIGKVLRQLIHMITSRGTQWTGVLNIVLCRLNPELPKNKNNTQKKILEMVNDRST